MSTRTYLDRVFGPRVLGPEVLRRKTEGQAQDCFLPQTKVAPDSPYGESGAWKKTT